MTEKIIYLINDKNDGEEPPYFICTSPAPTDDYDKNNAIKYVRDNGETQELLSVIKDCLSYADAQAVLKQGEAVELRDKCRAVIEKVEVFNDANT